MATRTTTARGLTIRRRSRITRFLPRFDSETPLTVDGARFDKLELRREFNLDGIQRDYDSGNELGRLITDEHRCLSAANVQLDERCNAFVGFSSGAGNGGVKVLEGRSWEGRRWLVALNVEFRAVRPPPEQDTLQATRPRMRVIVSLTLNPSRLAAHALRRAIDPAVADWRELLTSDEQTFQSVSSESVNMQQDNILPPSAFEHPVSIATSAQQTQRFVSAIDELLNHIVSGDGTIRGESLTFAAVRPWTLKQAEVYWEFGHHGAIGYLRGMRAALWSICNDMRERVWALDDGVDAISYSMRLTATARLALYAKGLDRVRLETRYNSKPVGGALAELTERLEQIAADACIRASDARNAILRRCGESQSSNTGIGHADLLADLVSRLAHYYRARPDRLEDVLRMVLTRGGVRTGDGFLVDTTEAQQLVRAGVLESTRVGNASSSGNLYPLVARLQPLFELFHET